MTSRSRAAAAAFAAVFTPALLCGTALAEVAHPPVAGTAWYWQRQHKQSVEDPSGGGTLATVALPDPYCPGVAGVETPEQTCKRGRLPTEVSAGDYRHPDAVSAVMFDLSSIPLGSKVHRFTVSFREANGDARSAAVNADGKKLRACVVTDYFGSGAARDYKEMPEHRCDRDDPVATRKPVRKRSGKTTARTVPGPSPAPDPADDYRWTFDLTKLARRWVKSGTVNTGVIFYPVRPPAKRYDPASDDDWRVVFRGPQSKAGVETTLVYEPARLPKTTAPAGSPDGPGGAGGGFTTTTATSPSDGFSGGSGTTSTRLGGSGRAAPPGVPQGDSRHTGPRQTVAASGRSPQPVGLPGYVWIAILGGVAGLMLLRAAVLEPPDGPRPDGVLAQIRRINAQRRGEAPPADPGTPGFGSAWGAARAAGGRIARGFGSLAARLRSG
jgi:hypothetical protein